MTTIQERVDSATTPKNKFNSWPDKLEVVGVAEYDLHKADKAYEAGILMGRASAGENSFRQIAPEAFPEGVKKNSWYSSTYFTLADPRGQGDDPSTRNLLAVYTLGSLSLIAVELGCKHDYETRRPYNCYVEGKCRKCGHKYFVDSSG